MTAGGKWLVRFALSARRGDPEETVQITVPAESEAAAIREAFRGRARGPVHSLRMLIVAPVAG